MARIAEAVLNRTPDKLSNYSVLMAKKSTSTSSNFIPDGFENFTKQENRSETLRFTFEGITSEIQVHHLPSGPLSIFLDSIVLNEGEEPSLMYPNEERKKRALRILEVANLI